MERCLKYPPSKFLANIGFIFWSAILLAPCADATASGVENPLAETHDHERSRRPWSTSGKYTAHKNFEEHFVSGRRLAGLVAPKPLVVGATASQGSCKHPHCGQMVGNYQRISGCVGRVRRAATHPQRRD
ncbi:uncharacterized protein [Physcomitrium patens]|uniref:uncharacterized protein n=1 Tax=Physcomitrium patens TaxID=3218 RepID=UPI003CCD5B27